MILRPLAAAGLLIAALTACAPQPPEPSKEDFSAVRELLSGSPALKKRTITQCTASVAAKPDDSRVVMAQLMNVPPQRVAATYCQRMIEGVASGRVTQAEMAAANSGKVSANLVRVLQGR